MFFLYGGDGDEGAENGDGVSRGCQGAGALAESVTLFDVYEGDQVEQGHRSLAFALRLRGDHTLTAKEAEDVRRAVVAKARKALGARLRA